MSAFYSIRKNSCWIKIFIVILACFVCNTYAEPLGKLIFLGKTHDLAYSVWVSATTAGSFELQAQGQQVVDQWSLSERGTHLSLSPFVSQGNGGTHFLIDQETGSTLDSQNQKNDFIFPPFPSIPELPPITPPSVILPPGRLSQEVSIKPKRTTKSAVQKDFLFSPKACWNVWSNNRYYDIHDNRFDLDSNGYAGTYTIGADKLISEDLVTGILLSMGNYHIEAFQGELSNKALGLMVGPYFGYQLSSKWTTEGSFTIGGWENSNKIAILDSHFMTYLANAFLNATGYYPYGQIMIKPNVFVQFSHFKNPAYQLKGRFRNIPFSVDREKDNFDFGMIHFSVEVNRNFLMNPIFLEPYTKLGANYQVVRPNEGQVLTSFLTLATVSPFFASATAGMRALISPTFLLEMSLGYKSLAQPDLDVWEAKLYLSKSFN